MQAEIIASAHQDEQAVDAVRGGDAERYRELVERHERRVYAVTWSRLGDATLAEEATQEAFIRAYRRLSLLGDGAKFGAWITAIARHVAINFGLRHRREMNKRQRWALEQSAASVSRSTEESTELCPPEMLRQTLAELPAAHRECLVLFYLEGKSGAEAAAALGISEAAFRVRLHRARGALRERLEEHLGESLGQLRPSYALVPSVMASILAFPAKLAGGAVAGVLSAIGKALPLQFVASFMGLVSFLPSMLFASWLGRVERRNYRDADGFRARLHRESYRRFLWTFPLLVVVIWLGTNAANLAWGMKGMFLAIGIFGLVLTAFSARLLTINRSRFQVGTFVYVLLLTLAEWAIAFDLLPLIAFNMFSILATLALIVVQRDRPLRMDYNLVLRATQGMLTTPPVDSRVQNRRLRLFPSDLRAFARFLGERWLVVNFRWEDQGLALRLPPLKPSMGGGIVDLFWRSWRQCSCITLGWDGAISAHCGSRDEESLGTPGGNLVEHTNLERQVAAAVELAWSFFREANLASAERVLGQVPDAELFIVSTARSAATRWRIWFVAGAAVLTVIAAGFSYWRPSSHHGLKPVSATETEIRAALSGLSTNRGPRPNNTFMGGLEYGLQICFALPSTNLFTPPAMNVVRQHLRQQSVAHMKAGEPLAIPVYSTLIQEALAKGWLTLPELGVTRDKARSVLGTLSARERAGYLQLQEMSVQDQSYKVLFVEGLPPQLQWLRTVDCLDFVDAPPIIAQLRASQVLTDRPIPDRRPSKYMSELRGLFLTSGWNPLRDTYYAVATLERLGGLDQIDRETCIQGLLRFHRGKGFFSAPLETSDFLISGDARDTFCVFESLRILGELDRVKDLDRWQFRPMITSTPDPSGTAPRRLTWDEIEAWVCQQRLERVLRERKENPEAPVQSLQEP